MNCRFSPLTAILLFFTFSSTAQIDLSKYSIDIKRIDTPPNIDGMLDDACWKDIEYAKNFTQFEPNLDALPTYDTQFKIAYDDEFFYFAAFLPDAQPDSILKELGYYDNIGANADYVCLFLDTYDDDQNGYGFCLSVSGIQSDARYSQSEGENWLWNAIWFSKTRITNKGWFAEVKIPYSSIRFPEQEIQNWGINVWRQLRRKRERSSWAPFNPNNNGFVNQWGGIKNITNIDAPVRLSLTPYFSLIHNRFNLNNAINTINTSNTYKGGADIKYGINESFTLDMTLIPDFGQTRSDDQVLNISPFEVQFDENRGFFLEGTELFNTDGLFYSRRIGGTPLNRFEVTNSVALDTNLTIIDNPLETQLINATKISGRTKGQTGLGFFNAVTAKTNALVEDGEGKQHKIETNPLTNYNIIVADQSLNNNSSVSFINTNVWREGVYRDANVSSFAFDLKNKAVQYGIWGGATMSNLFNHNHTDLDTVKTGYRYRLRAGKVSGRFKFNIGYFAETDQFDINDFGFLQRPNDNNWSAQIRYNINDPIWKINSSWNVVGLNYNRLYKPNKYVGYNMWGEHGVTWKNWLTTGFFWEMLPFGGYDYFEPRVKNRHIKLYPNYYCGAFISTDYRKTFAIDISSGYGEEPKVGDYAWHLNIQPRLRVNDKLRFRHAFRYDKNYNTGFLDLLDNQQVAFSQRDIDTYENTLNGSYIFTSRMALELRIRHYWRKLVPQKIVYLEDDGTTTAYELEGNYVNSASFFNVDLVYRWQFSPGSELSVVWKNAINQRNDLADDTFIDNFEKLNNAPANNNLSLKVVYFLDYLNVKKMLTSRNKKT